MKELQNLKSVELNRDVVMDSIAAVYPALLTEVNAILAEVKCHCLSSHDCFVYSERIVKLIENEVQKQEQKQQQKSSEQESKSGSESSEAANTDPGKETQKGRNREQ